MGIQVASFELIANIASTLSTISSTVPGAGTSVLACGIACHQHESCGGFIFEANSVSLKYIIRSCHFLLIKQSFDFFVFLHKETKLHKEWVLLYSYSFSITQFRISWTFSLHDIQSINIYIMKTFLIDLLNLEFRLPLLFGKIFAKFHSLMYFRTRDASLLWMLLFLAQLEATRRCATGWKVSGDRSWWTLHLRRPFPGCRYLNKSGS